MKPTNMNMQIQSMKELFNNIRDTLSRDEINKIRRNICKKEYVYNILSKKDKLKSKESKILNNIIGHLNKLHDDLLKQNKYQENMYALDLLFNVMIITSPWKLRALLMVTMNYMKVMVMKRVYYLYQSILLKLNCI